MIEGIVGLFFLINAQGQVLREPVVMPFDSAVECEDTIVTVNKGVQANPAMVAAGVSVVGICIEGEEIN